MIVLLTLTHISLASRMSNNNGRGRDANKLWEQLFGRQGHAQREETNNTPTSNTSNNVTFRDIATFGQLLHIQSRARTIQQYQNDQAQLNDQLSIMRSLVSGGLPFNTANASLQSNFPSNSVNSAGLRHQSSQPKQPSPNVSDTSQLSNAVMKMMLPKRTLM